MTDDLVAPATSDAPTSAMLAEVRRLLQRVQPGYQQWGHSKTVEYKTWAQKAHRCLESARPSRKSVIEALQALRGYQ